MAPITIPHPPRFWRRGDALAWPPQRQESATRTAVDGDTVIRYLTAGVVIGVAAFAAIVSYSHIYDLGRLHAQQGTAARLLPLSVDGLILAGSLILLHEARNQRPGYWLGRLALWLGIGATLAANVLSGLPSGWLSAVISAWPAAAFIVATEALMGLVQRSRGRPAAPGAQVTAPAGVEVTPPPVSGQAPGRPAAGLQAVPEVTPAPPSQATSGAHSGQPAGRASGRPQAAARRRLPAGRKAISDADLSELVRAALAADPDVTLAALAKKLGRSRDRLRPLMEKVRREADPAGDI